MLKYEHIQPGARVRAYDHEPRDGVGERYVEGQVIRHDTMPSCGYRALVVLCDVDTVFSSENYDGTSYTRTGQEIYVPMEMMPDYNGRVKVVIGE